MNIAESTFEFWAKGPGDTEAQKCANAESAVRKAIDADKALNGLNISVFPQGSYKARTNVRQESDVDICVRCNSVFFDHYPSGKKREDFGNHDEKLRYADFKNMVHHALVEYFGEKGVTPGNKAFDVHANSYRIDADVVPTFEYRYYTGQFNSDGSHSYLSGVAFDPDSGNRIINWPTHNYERGVAKNTDCNRHYKRVVRILKRLSYKMREEKVSGADGIGSFLVESLVFNAPKETFSHEKYSDDVRAAIVYLWNATKPGVDTGTKMTEVNGCKYLFGDHQSWTREQVHNFLAQAWNYIGFK